MKNKKFITQKVFVQEHSGFQEHFGFHIGKKKIYKRYLGSESPFRAKKGNLFSLNVEITHKVEHILSYC